MSLRITPQPQPAPVTSGQVFPLPDQEHAAMVQRALQGNAQRAANDAAAARAAQCPPQPERRTDEQARQMLREGEAALAEIHEICEQLRLNVEEAQAETKKAEAELQSLQSTYQAALETCVTTPGAARPRDISQDIQLARARIGMCIDAQDQAEKVYREASSSYQDATRDIRDVISKAYHYLALNAADRLADRLESALIEATNASAALEGLRDYAVDVAKDTELQKWCVRCLEGRRDRTPDEVMKWREKISTDAFALRQKFQNRHNLAG